MKTENIKLWDWVVWNQGLKPKIKWKPVKIIKYFPSKHLSWWRRLENVFRLHLQKTSSGRLDQDKYIHPTHTSSEDVFKTCSRRLAKTTSRHLEDVFKTSSRRLAKTFSRRLAKTSSRHLQNVLKTSSRHLAKMLQNLFKTYHWVNLFLLTRFQDVFETFSKRF